MRPRSCVRASKQCRRVRSRPDIRSDSRTCRSIRHIVFFPALRTVYPALASQFVLLMLGSSIVSAISVEELTGIINTLQSTTFRAFEFYFVATADLSRDGLRHALAVARDLRDGLRARTSARAGEDAVSRDFGWAEFAFLLGAMRWTVVLSLIAFVGGGSAASSSRSPGPRPMRCCAVSPRATSA